MKHKLAITQYSFGRLIAKCSCGKFSKQYLLSLENEDNVKLKKQIQKDFDKHIK